MATGLGSCFRFKEPAVRGRPVLSADGRGPNFTFGRYKLAKSKSRVEGLVDWEDFRGSALGCDSWSRKCCWWVAGGLSSS